MHDLQGFFVKLAELEAEVRADVSEDDAKHFRKIRRIGRACSAAGWATSVFGPNLLSAALIAQGRTMRFAIVAHHVTHGGYDKVPGQPARHQSKGFASGLRRFRDWLDVIQADGWHLEHNVLHHAYTGAEQDPDVVERNLKWLRDADLPTPVKLAYAAVLMSTWKWVYYAPNTLQESMAAEARRDGGTFERLAYGDPKLWDPRSPTGKRLWFGALLPYAGVNFVLLPAMMLPFGPYVAASAAANSVMAEWITNLHTFVVIATNHAGDDVPVFQGPPASLDAFKLRQIVGSNNYATGGDLNDVMHGWLNYQIEHHLWPDLSLLQYRKVQPKLKALCEAHGVPYRQESVFRRLGKTVRAMTTDKDKAIAAY